MPDANVGGGPRQQRPNDDLGDPFQKFDDSPAPARPAPAKAATPAPAKTPVAPAKTPAPAKNATPPAPAKTPAKPATPPKADEGKAPVDKTPVDDLDAEGKPAEQPKEPAPVETFTGPKALRDAYEKLRTEYKAEKQKFAAEVEQMRNSGKISSDPAHAELQTKYKELEERYKHHEAELQYRDFEASEKFKTEYHAPYVKAWTEATAQLRDYRALNEDGTERQATNEDLTAVVRASSTPEARRIAKELFGPDDANDIVNLRSKILEKHRSMEEAKAEFRTKGTERAAQQQREMEEASTKAETEWHRLNKEAVEKYPQWFKAEEGDEKGEAILKEGFELADRAWDGRGMKPEELLRLRSAMRNRAGAFRYVAHRLQGATAEIAELKAKLAEFEASAPGGGKPPEDGQKVGGDPLGDPFAKYENEARHIN